MSTIQISSDAFDAARSKLAQAQAQLSEAGGTLGSAVPAMAFGPLGAFIPPVINGLGALVEGAAGITGALAQRTADGVRTAVTGFEDVDTAADSDFSAIEAQL